VPTLNTIDTQTRPKLINFSVKLKCAVFDSLI
jgi:hypothetical protein